MDLRGAFVDSKGVRWDTNDADFEGALSKQSKWVKEWRRRYFVLKGSKLFFAKTNLAAPHGMVDLVDSISVKSADAKIKRQFAIEIATNDEMIYVCAESEREKDEWIAALGKAIMKHSSMLIMDNDDDDEDDDNDAKDS